MKEFDDIFKRNLEHHTMDVPKDSWDKIAQQLPRKKFTLTPIGLASAFAVVLVGIVAFGIFISVNHINEVNSDSSIVSNDKMTASVDSGFSENTEPSYTETQKQVLSSSSTHPINITTNSSDNLSNIDQRISDNKSEIYVAENKISIEVDSDTDAAPIESLDKILSAQSENIENSVLVTDFVNSEEPRLTENINSTIDKSTIEYLTQKTTDEMSIGSLDQQEVKYEKSLRHFSGDKEACSFLWGGYNRSVDIYFSSDFVDMKIEGPASLSEHIDMRKATETSVYSFSAGARLGYNLGYRWNLHTGINYSQMTQRFQYTNPEANEPRVEIIKKYIFSNGQLVDSTFTEETVYLPGSKYHKIYNIYRTWDIPVLVRYTLAANNKMSLSAVGGVFFNVSFQQSGIILDTDNVRPIFLNDINPEEVQIFKAGLGVSAYASLSLAYYLSPSLDLLIEPNARISPMSMTTSKYPLSQRFNTYGLSVGLRHRF